MIQLFVNLITIIGEVSQRHEFDFFCAKNIILKIMKFLLWVEIWDTLFLLSRISKQHLNLLGVKITFLQLVEAVQSCYKKPASCIFSKKYVNILNKF